jgi:Zn finger protein HypA/HybF involved in hydrogenase expression
MITEIADSKLENGSILCRHTIEIYCPKCSRDVDAEELAAKKCNDCGEDLSAPEQHVAIVVANLSSGGRTLE